MQLDGQVIGMRAIAGDPVDDYGNTGRRPDLPCCSPSGTPAKRTMRPASAGAAVSGARVVAWNLISKVRPGASAVKADWIALNRVLCAGIPFFSSKPTQDIAQRDGFAGRLLCP